MRPTINTKYDWGFRISDIGLLGKSAKRREYEVVSAALFIRRETLAGLLGKIAHRTIIS